MNRLLSRRRFLRIATLAAGAPMFDVRLPRGLDFTLQNSPTPQKYLIETMPGGVALFDYDNDGYPDLFVTSYGKNILYHNNGNGTFTDVTAKAGVAGGGWSVSAGFFDYDNDGHLDLFVTRYMEWDTKRSKTCGGAWQTYCPPAEFPATTNLLYRNRGDGTFEDVSQKSGIAVKKGRALGAAFADYDDDGFTDIFVANDGMQQYLYHNNG